MRSVDLGVVMVIVGTEQHCDFWTFTVEPLRGVSGVDCETESSLIEVRGTDVGVRLGMSRSLERISVGESRDWDLPGLSEISSLPECN